jgi:hypothetical protein
MRGAQWYKCAMPACTQLHTWQTRRELVTGAGGARGARRRRASGGGCRWMMPQWQRWPAWASSLHWCVRARSQRLVMHAFNCALPHHACTSTMCACGAPCEHAPLCWTGLPHICSLSAPTQLCCFARAKRCNCTHCGGAHPTPTPRAACRPSARCASAPATCPRPPPLRRTSARARARAARSSGARPRCVASRSCARPASMAATVHALLVAELEARCGQPEYPATKSLSCTHRCGLQRGRSTVSMHTLLAVLPARTEGDPQAVPTACKPAPRACLHALPRPARLTGRCAARRARSHHRASEARRLQVRADGGGRARGHGRAGPAGLAGLRAAAGRRGPAAGKPRWRLSCHRHARAERAASPFVAPTLRGRRRACAGLPVGICGNHVQL